MNPLAKHLKIALGKFYGVMDSENEIFNSVMADTNFLPGHRFYCVHCGGPGPKPNKVTHAEGCWYHNAKRALAEALRQPQISNTVLTLQAAAVVDSEEPLKQEYKDA